MEPPIESHLIERRVFKPSKDFSENSRIKNLKQYQAIYKESIEDPTQFWASQAAELKWQQPWSKVLEWNPPFAKWFVGGKLNVCENCVDRHLDSAKRTQTAIVWEGENGDARKLTYEQLHKEVCQFANVLKRHHVKKGDRVIIYLPLVPEAVVAMLACARIGAVHCVIFGGFSAESIRDRIADSGAKLIVTADGGYRRGSIVPLKANVDAALQSNPQSIERVIVLKRCANAVDFHKDRDVWWHEELEKVDAHCPAEGFESDHPLYILYTSGSTGKPKGILHTSGGYLTGVTSTCKYIFDFREDDLYWCTADVGWVTGHSYLVYGPLASGACVFMYEGAPNFPQPDRWWELIAKYGITILYTAPTAIRAFIKQGDQWPNKHDLTSLRLLGSVGEPINPEAWMWYYRVIGKERCPIVDTWWQTETGGIMISPFPGATPLKPGSATLPFFGIDAAVVDEHGNEVPANVGGKLVIRKPWPAMLHTIYKNEERYHKAYWSEYADLGFYFSSDGARKDEDGYFWIIGRIDDVLNVAGHRLGTAEIESALVSHESIAEAAVVGCPDEIKGHGIAAFVIPKSGYAPDENLKQNLRAHVSQVIGPIAKPDHIFFTDALPKTRSGKIMRRLLREVAAGNEVAGDTTTLEDIQTLTKLHDGPSLDTSYTSDGCRPTPSL